MEENTNKPTNITEPENTNKPINTNELNNTNQLNKTQLYKKQWAENNRQKIVEAKRRFYDKMKNNPEFMENIRQKAKERYRLKKESEGKEVKPRIPTTELEPIEKKPRGRPRVHP